MFSNKNIKISKKERKSSEVIRELTDVLNRQKPQHSSQEGISIQPCIRI